MLCARQNAEYVHATLHAAVSLLANSIGEQPPAKTSMSIMSPTYSRLRLASRSHAQMPGVVCGMRRHESPSYAAARHVSLARLQNRLSCRHFRPCAMKHRVRYLMPRPSFTPRRHCHAAMRRHYPGAVRAYVATPALLMLNAALTVDKKDVTLTRASR